MSPIIEPANALSISAFRTKFLPNLATLCQASTTPTRTSSTASHYSLTLENSSTLTKADFESCYHLIKLTSFDAYQSSGGWSPTKKRKEMRLPDLRYLIVKNSAEEGSTTDIEELVGFLSFMLTYEDGYEVIYCYEIHLKPELRGTGVGKRLMGMMEEVGRKAAVAKAMLTVFVENEGALNFYERLGFETDEYSPAPKILRNGVVKNPTYLILSKSLA